MRTLRIPASVALAAGVITPARADNDGGNCGTAPRAPRMAEDRAKSRAPEPCYEVQSAEDGLQNDPVTAAAAKTGGASR
jgi:hypothetical protein